MSLKLRRKVYGCGGGLLISVPADIAKALKIDGNSKVLIWIEDTRMIVEKVEAEE